MTRKYFFFGFLMFILGLVSGISVLEAAAQIDLVAIDPPVIDTNIQQIRQVDTATGTILLVEPVALVDQKPEVLISNIEELSLLSSKYAKLYDSCKNK